MKQWSASRATPTCTIRPAHTSRAACLTIYAHAQVEEGPAFVRVREAVERKLRNAHLEPAHHAASLRLRCLTHLWPLEQRLEAVQCATPASLQVSMA